jgi:hypothetical protein
MAASVLVHDSLPVHLAENIKAYFTAHFMDNVVYRILH